MMRVSVKAAFEIALHAALLSVPVFLSAVLHASDSLYRQVPTNESELSSNITTVGFGLRHFSILFNETTEEEDIRFSDEQQEALGSNYLTAHTLYHVLNGLMWICLILPLIVSMDNRRRRNTEPLLAMSQLATSLGTVYVPWMIVLTLLMAVPFALLSQSNLCGPSYLQLGYDIEDAGHHDEDLEGTYAITHSDIPTKCEIGASSIGFIAGTVAWPLVLLMQANILRRRGHKLELNHQLAIVLDRKNFDVKECSLDGSEKELADDETSYSDSDAGNESLGGIRYI